MIWSPEKQQGRRQKKKTPAKHDPKLGRKSWSKKQNKKSSYDMYPRELLEESGPTNWYMNE